LRVRRGKCWRGAVSPDPRPLPDPCDPCPPTLAPRHLPPDPCPTLATLDPRPSTLARRRPLPQHLPPARGVPSLRSTACTAPPPRPVNAAGVAEAHRARRRTSQAMANVTVTEADFEEFVLDKGFVPLPADYTPTHLFFQAEAEGETFCKVARMGVTDLGARVREARATARRVHTKSKGVHQPRVGGRPPEQQVLARRPSSTAAASPVIAGVAENEEKPSALSEEVCLCLRSPLPLQPSFLPKPCPILRQPLPQPLPNPGPLALGPWPLALDPWSLILDL
jgi:hypothetical protein